MPSKLEDDDVKDPRTVAARVCAHHDCGDELELDDHETAPALAAVLALVRRDAKARQTRTAKATRGNRAAAVRLTRMSQTFPAVVAEPAE